MDQFDKTVRPPQGKRQARMDFIDRACGLAICSVVYAHILFPETLNVKWYQKSEVFIYKFHMPLFICLSGYLAFLSATNARINSESVYWYFQKKKFFKFLPVYFLFSLSSVLVDFFFHHITIQEFRNYIFSILFSPTQGSAVFLWYLYILMGFYLITPFLINLRASTQFLLLAITFLLTNVSLTPIFCFDFFCKFLFFFLWGGLIYKHSDRFFLFLDKKGKWILVMTLILTILDFFTRFAIPFQVMSLLIIPSVLYISRLHWPGMLSKIFVTIGISSFAIYLLNTSLINLFYILFKSFLKVEINAFFIFSCFILTVGFAILMRILFNKLIPSRIYAL